MYIHDKTVTSTVHSTHILQDVPTSKKHADPTEIEELVDGHDN